MTAALFYSTTTIAILNILKSSMSRDNIADVCRPTNFYVHTCGICGNHSGFD